MSKRWTPEEIDFLFANTGKYPLAILCKKLNKKFGNNRSLQTTQVKINCLGMKSKVEIDYLSKQQWAKEFGFKYSNRISDWCKKGLKVLKINDFNHAITIEAMKNFATKQPQLFHGINYDILVYYFGESLALKIKNSSYKKKPISIIANGQKFASIQEASKALKMSRRTIANELSLPSSWIKRN